MALLWTSVEKIACFLFLEIIHKVVRVAQLVRASDS